MISPTHPSPVGGGGMGMGMGGDGFVPPATLRSNPGAIPGIARSTRSPSDAGAASPMTPRVPPRSLSSGPMGMVALGTGAGGAIPGTEDYQRMLLQQQQGQVARLVQQQQGNGPPNPSFNAQGMGWGGPGAGGAGHPLGGGDVSRQMSATPNSAGQQGIGMGGMGAGMGMGGMGGMGMGAMNGGMNMGGMGGGVGGMGGMGGEQGLGGGDYDFLQSTSW